MAAGPLTGDNSNNGSPSEDDNSSEKMGLETGDSCSHNRQPDYRRGAGSLRLENLVKVSLNCRSKVGAKELKRKLVGELDRVRKLVKRIEYKESRDGGYGHSQCSGNDAKQKLGRIVPEVGSKGKPDLKSSRGLDVSVAENNHGVGKIVKEKRMVKDGQCYQNSNVPIRKDKVPIPEGKEKLKTKGASRDGADKNVSMLFKNSSQLLKSCNDLLAKLMKHKHGWVFNKPVDVKRLQLHDYYTIVKHPMDLGTVKSRLSKNWYKSAEEFAEDVRLTFGNAMLYNPKGQDVHIMADLLLKLFEENWATLEARYKPKKRPEMRNDATLPTETSRKISTPTPAPNCNAPLVHAPSPPQDRVPQLQDPETRTLDRAESMTKPADSKSNPARSSHSGRMPVPKKPKVRDPEIRPMTLEEKQKLSIDLQNLPSEKLGTVVEIIKKRNPPLSQEDDEIEVDIDAVDPETLWELDRFIANHKKGLSKNKRNAEHALHTNAEVGHTIQENLAPATAESPKQTETGNVEKNFTSPFQLEKAPPLVQVEEPCSPVQVEKQGDNVSGSSSSSSSSSGSGSSSSDSDSNSSSASGSDAGH